MKGREKKDDDNNMKKTKWKDMREERKKGRKKVRIITQQYEKD